MMHKKDRFGYAERDSFTLLHLPYVGKNIAMMVLLPRFMDGLSSLEKQLTTKFLEELRKEMRPIKVNVSLPKFKIEYTKSLVGTLQDLGMRSAFEAADLGGMSCSQDLYVSDVFHKAVVEVNEEGSEAAAATAVMVGLRCMPIREVVPDFVVDHPFLFAIVDMKSNATLFLGRISEL
ncbi:hypothetical protein JTE90_020362 [Oedothorax gibbosus]|uniref:Serpin domain-containing protein n=1 Tax=Oedothorax gibbosus TaxID=931172 RepID=A0AAV6TXS6_9ARAC|nr:hypothetical protein JTE90_020362 [Oedothorax gibbosus]